MTWPKQELVATGSPEMPMPERVMRYRANVLAICDAGHTMPSAMVDTLGRAMRRIGERPDDTAFPSPLP